ncbi:MAG: hypothetical protein WKF36_09820 [Candidatus Nitrosocosmicus sp.]
MSSVSELGFPLALNRGGTEVSDYFPYKKKKWIYPVKIPAS